MSALVLQIKWKKSLEYVPLDLSVDAHEGVVDTYEIWDSGERVEYRARYMRTIDENGAYQFTLDYVLEENSLVVEWQGGELGVSRIDIPRDRRKTSAFWTSETDPDWTGPAGQCRIVHDTTMDTQREIERVNRSVIKRPGQVLLREMLLAIDACCAISKESTQAALEAAHINAVADRGADAISNGILLRADLHRLYDSGAFDITPEGNITFVPGLSGAYRKLLAEARIDENIMERIRSNLKLRQPRA